MSRSTRPEAYIEAAANTPLFFGLESDTIAALLAIDGVTVKHYASGESIYSSHSFSRCLGFVVSGAARVVKNKSEGAMPMSVLHAGELFGAAALFNGDARYVADICAQGSTWAVLISEEALSAMMRMEFAVAKNYIEYLTQRIRFLSARLDGFVPPTVEERLLDYIRLNSHDGVFRPERGMTGVANALRVSRATLYRACEALQLEGRLIKVGKTLRLMEKE